jgi:hypothetical protein
MVGKMFTILKNVVTMVLVSSSLSLAVSSQVDAHGGGLDSDGGHNCRVGSCAGTYHCHQSRGPGCGGGGYRSGGYSTPRITPAFCVALEGGYFTKSEIAQIQTALSVRGHRPGPIDGIYGRQTRSALNRFEKKEKLTMSSGNSLYFRSIERLGIAC